MIRTGLILVLLVAASSVEAQDEETARGKAIAETNCARCHQIGPEGDSPLAGAPPFRTLGRNYPVSDLEEALAEGIITAHPTMPEFVFQPDDAAALIAYLESIQER